MITLSKLQCPSKWDLRFLALAKMIASWSKDDKHKVGAVIVSNDNHVLATGFNGAPKGIDTVLSDKTNVIHAELNAIINSTASLENSTLYVYPLLPCAHCAALLINRGIRRVVCVKGETSAKWQPQAALDMLSRSNIQVQIVEDDV